MTISILQQSHVNLLGRNPRRHAALALVLCLVACAQVTGKAADTVVIRVDPTRDRKPISPYIYGSNQDLQGFNRWTAMRLSGNRMSTYNWENNASNAGEDGIPPHTSDNWWLTQGLDGYWLGLKGKYPIGSDTPAAVYQRFHRLAIDRQAYSLVGLQTAGYVAADTDHVVGEQETAPSKRWVRVQPASPPNSGIKPDLADGVVYQDQLIRHLISGFGNASQPGGIRGYGLDNEPGLWHKTHPHMHPKPATWGEVIDKSVALAKVVKDIDPEAQTFGPSLWGMTGFAKLSDASDWKQVNHDGRYRWFIDYYLDQMAKASRQQGVRLLDVLDLHWYTEAEAIQNAGPTAVVNAPRSLYDTHYREPTWISQWFSDFLPVLVKARESIDKYYPGTELAVTEYNWLMADKIHGGLAQADSLGAFGKLGVYMACYYQPIWRGDNRYAAAAFRLFRNYDGQGGTFGDVSVFAESSLPQQVAVYASQSTADNTLHLILIHRGEDRPASVQIEISPAFRFRKTEAWYFDSQSDELHRVNSFKRINTQAIRSELPPLSATHFILRQQPAGPISR